MLNKQNLHTLLGLIVPSHAPVISIYCPQMSNRFIYVTEFIFKQVLKVNISYTSNLSEFSNTSGLKLNYSPSVVANAYHISPAGLLEQTGISEQKPELKQKGRSAYFYETNSDSLHSNNAFHFDIFSSVFYLISRYEEWQYFTPDQHGRFEATQSCLMPLGLSQQPLVDQWIFELKKALENYYPDFIFPVTHFQVISTIDVDNLYAFRMKGIVRTLGASLKDVFKADLKNIILRAKVLSKKLPDPFDIYASLSDFCFQKKISLLYFFLLKSGDQYNRTVEPSTGAFKKVFQTLKQNYALFGLHPSYQTAYEPAQLTKEIQEFSNQSGENVSISRQHYLRFDIKSTPQLLLKNGIMADFTMGFASQAGFRAGTSHPFYYFDFNSETKSELLFVPFCIMDGVFTVYKKNDAEEALKVMLSLAKSLKEVNGLFISVFHERSFSDHLYPGFGTLYKKLHEALQDL